MRKCVLYYCHRVTTQLQLTNISKKTKADTGQQFCALASDRKDRVHFKGAQGTGTVQLYEACRKLRNEEFHETNSPRNITRMDQRRKRSWVEHAARAVEMTNV